MIVFFNSEVQMHCEGIWSDCCFIRAIMLDGSLIVARTLSAVAGPGWGGTAELAGSILAA
jgi:hypothetical protein